MSTKKLPIPKNPGAAVDLLTALRAQRDALDAQSKALKAQEEAVEALLADMLRKAGLRAAKGVNGGAVHFATRRVVEVTNWAAYNAYIIKHKALELLHKRASSTAILERIDAGKVVPGAEVREVEDLVFVKPKANGGAR